MKRREFLISAGALALRAETSGPILESVRSFWLDVPPNSLVVLLESTHDALYYVSQTQGGKTAKHALGCTDRNGSHRWQRELPTRVLPGAMGIRSGGSIVLTLYRLGSGFVMLEFRNDGTLVRERALAAGKPARSYAIVGDQLVSFLADSSVEAMDLETAVVRRYPAILPDCNVAALHAMSDHGVMIVDESIPRFAVLNFREGSRRLEAIKSEAITSSLNRAKAEDAEHRGREGQGHPNNHAQATSRRVFFGSHLAQDGRLFGMVSPVNRSQGVLVIGVSSSGAGDWQVRLRVPDREIKRFPPTMLAVFDRELFAVYPDGDVAVYSMPELDWHQGGLSGRVARTIEAPLQDRVGPASMRPTIRA